MWQSGIVPLGDIRPATFIGKGKVEEIAGLVKSDEAGIVVMDCALSPVQQRNLEKAWSAKVVDRTGLILEIFGRRARTREGALQVELAHLTYQKSRLVRSWTHLERQRGGFGFLGGPGETQIETDRRLIEERIAPHRGRAREGQAHAQAPSRQPQARAVSDRGAGRLHQCRQVDAVQSPDAGQRALRRHAVCHARPDVARGRAADGLRVILSDTVGFISDLPTMLVAAFRATLEEVIEADLILHVRDISHEDAEAQSHDVEDVLRQLGIDRTRRRPVARGLEQDRPARGRRAPALAQSRRTSGRHRVVRCWSPRISGEGLDRLAAEIEPRLAAGRVTLDFVLDAADGAGLSWLHRHTEVMSKALRDDGALAVTVRADPANAQKARARFGRPEAHAH